MAKTPACNLRANEKYQAKAIRRIVLKMNRFTMPKMLEFLESKDSMQGYILSLIEEDMRRLGMSTDDRTEAE